MFRAAMLGTAGILSILLVSHAAEAQAVNYGASLPNPGIPGYNFPEPESTILGWVNNQPADTAKIYLHGWGLWASLTAPYLTILAASRGRPGGKCATVAWRGGIRGLGSIRTTARCPMPSSRRS